MPEFAELAITLPDVLGERSAVVRELVERIRVVEQSCAAARHASSQRIPGRRRIIEANWTDTAHSQKPRSGLSPTVASRDRDVRLTALRALRDFRDAYRAARDRLLCGGIAIFPLGTYWLQRFAAVATADG